MKFGITTSKIDEIGLITRAENLGYDFCWVSDTQMIRSNPWAVLALAAHQTRTIRIGTGVAVAGLRLAPVTANAIATINRIAPGRTFLGIGSGNTAMRAMGQAPMGVKAFGDYIRVVQGLLKGDEVEYTLNGVTHPIQFQNQEFKYIDVENHIPVHVGGFGPRAQALAGEIGDGLITGIPRGGTIPQAMENVQKGIKKSGRSLDGFETFGVVNILMLKPKEKLTDESVIMQCGSAIMANIHFVVDWVKETGNPPPEYILPFWDEYMDFHKKRDAERAHMKLHQSHYSYLDPEEARFITPEIIKAFTIAGQPDEMVEQLKKNLGKQGLDAVNFIAPLEQQYRLIEDFAYNVISGM